MAQNLLRRTALLAAALCPFVLRADPLHPLAGNSYWHHESNFIFPATLAEFARVGAPQELDGSPMVVAYYARGTGAARRLVVIEILPVAAGASAAATGSMGLVRVIERAGWRVAIRAMAPDDSTSMQIDALIGALPVDRLGTIDTRCPNPGCGT